MTTNGGIGWANRALALALACVLGALWLRTGWPLLAQGVLPDSDDMVRLAQIRDWLGGQAFRDLSQHRLGIDGSGAMHWSRIGDFGVAGLIIGLRPWLGAAQAEWVAVVAWPLILFAFALGAAGRLALAVGDRGHATLAILIFAFAFPAITMFVPGRIDHHGLQIVLALVLAEAVIMRRGVVAGLVAAIMLAIGLETAPMVAVAMAAFAIDYAHDPYQRAPFARFGGAVGSATLAWLLFARPLVWPAGWCDGFTPASSHATLVAAGWFVITALSPPRLRLAVGVVLAAPALWLAWRGAAVCVTGPYGPVDPVLARLWLGQVEEARPLFGDGIGKAMAFGGLALTGALAALWQLWLRQARGWAVLLAFQAVAVLIMLVQLRGSALAAAFAAPALAMLVAHVRARGGVVLLLGAWLVSAGLVWSTAGRALDTRSAPPAQRAGADCTAPETLRQLARLKPGRVIATIDAGAFMLGRTRHHVLAAPYHRNNRGNRAVYDFWLADPAAAARVAAATRADYVLVCPNAFGAITLPRESMAVRLDRGAVPGWLAPVPLKASAARLYRVLPRAVSRR